MTAVRFAIVVCTACCALALGSQRAACGDEAFARWVQGLLAEAGAMGLSRATFDAAFKGVSPDLSLPDLSLPGREKQIKGQAEFIRPPKDYLNRAYLATLAEQGKTLLSRHAATLG